MWSMVFLPDPTRGQRPVTPVPQRMESGESGNRHRRRHRHTAILFLNAPSSHVRPAPPPPPPKPTVGVRAHLPCAVLGSCTALPCSSSPVAKYCGCRSCVPPSMISLHRPVSASGVRHAHASAGPLAVAVAFNGDGEVPPAWVRLRGDRFAAASGRSTITLRMSSCVWRHSGDRAAKPWTHLRYTARAPLRAVIPAPPITSIVPGVRRAGVPTRVACPGPGQRTCTCAHSLVVTGVDASMVGDAFTSSNHTPRASSIRKS